MPPANGARDPVPAPVIKVTRAAVLGALGISERQLGRLEAAGTVRSLARAAGRPTQYDLVAVFRSYLEHKLRTDQAMSPKDKRDLAQAHFVEMKMAQQQGTMLPRAEFIKLGQALATALDAAMRNLPNRLVNAGVIMSAQEPEVVAAIDELRLEISRWRSVEALATDGPDDAA
jgi:hypothetical protein